MVSAKFEGTHCVDEAARREAQSLAHLRVDALDLVDRAEQLVRNLQVGLADGVEDRVFAPLGRGEAAVFLLGSGRGGHPAEHLAPRFQPLRPRLRARAHQRHWIGRRRHFPNPIAGCVQPVPKDGRGWPAFICSAQNSIIIC